MNHIFKDIFMSKRNKLLKYQSLKFRKIYAKFSSIQYF